MAAHLYWRFFIGSHNGSNFNFNALWSLDFQDASGVSLCIGGTPFASTSYGGNVPAHAFGPTPSGWISNNEQPCSIGYQFTSPVDPAKITLAPWNAGNYPVMILVQWSDDGTTYTDEYIITQPAAWVNQQLYTMLKPSGASTAQYWLMNPTVTANSAPASACQIAEMRFLDYLGAAFTGFTDTRGSNTGGGYSWAAAWNNNPADSVYTTQGSLNDFGQVMYPTEVQVVGLSITAVTDGFFLPYTPAEGRIYSSIDGMIWGHVWNFGPDNATGLPIVTGGTVTYAVPPPSPPAPPPPSPNPVTSQAMLGSF